MDKIPIHILYDCVLPNSVLANAVQTELGMVSYLSSFHNTCHADSTYFDRQLPTGSDEITALTYMFGKSYGTWPNSSSGTRLTHAIMTTLVDPKEDALYFGRKRIEKYIYPIKASPYMDAFTGAHFEGTKIAGNFFWKYMSSQALEDVKNRRAIILLDYGEENFVTQDTYENLHIALSFSDIPPEQIVLAFNSFNAEELYTKWFYKNERKLIVKNFPYVINNTSHFYDTITKDDQGRIGTDTFLKSKRKIRDNYFLFKVRRARPYRVALAMAMHEDGLLEQADWSFLTKLDRVDWLSSIYGKDYGFKLSEKKIDQFCAKTPKTLVHEREDTYDTISSWTDSQIKSYLNAYFYVCTETYTEGPYKSVTEKICKPMANFMPFLFNSFPGALALLRSLGFKTFHPFIDESYDGEPNSQKRTYMIYQEIKRLCAMDKKELHKWYWKQQDILIHNRETLLNLYKVDSTLKNFIMYLNERLYL